MTQILFYEDIEPETQIIGETTTIAESEMLQFAQIWDLVPIHVDRELATRVMGGLTAPGLYLLAVKQRLIHKLDQKAAVIVSLGYDEVRFMQPVHAGDELTLVLDWLCKRPSRSRGDRGDRGIVRHRLSLVNSQGETVMTHLDTILVKRRTE